MSALLGADTRRVDLIAEGLRGYAQDVANLRTVAQHAVAEMRGGWGGADFEDIAHRWAHEAGPRLMEASLALSTMATALRTEAEQQRQTSGNMSGSAPGGFDIGGGPGGGGGAGGGSSWGGDRKRIEGPDPDPLVNGHLVGVRRSVKIDALGQGFTEPTFGDKVKDNVRLNLARGDVGVDLSLASLRDEKGDYQYELSVGKVEAKAEHSVDVDAHGNLVASAGASAAAYAGFAAGRVKRGNELANVGAAAEAYVGAETKAEASGSIGPNGAKGQVGLEAFAGARAEAEAGGTVAGVTAAAGAEISYGVGAHADVDGQLSTTGIGMSVDVGAALGIGAGVSFDASVDPHDVVANVDHVVDRIGDAVEVRVASFLPW